MRYCDFDCEHAAFPEVDMLGACRTMAAVFCKKLGKVVSKHTSCQADEEVDDDGETE